MWIQPVLQETLMFDFYKGQKTTQTRNSVSSDLEVLNDPFLPFLKIERLHDTTPPISIFSD
jgi:hypothetical protein